MSNVVSRRQAIRTAAAGGAVGALGFGLPVTACCTVPEAPREAPRAPSTQGGPAAPAWHRITALKFFGYPIDTNTMTSIPMPDETAAAVRTTMLAIPGVEDAVALAFAQMISATDEKAAADSFWKVLTEGTSTKPGLLKALQPQFGADATGLMTGAYLRRDEPPYDHIKVGFVMFAKTGANPELFAPAMSVQRGNLTINFKAHVKVAITVARVGW